MQEQFDHSPMGLLRPDPARLEARVREARRLYQRSLASWVSDLLELRRRSARQGGWQDATSSDASRWAA